MIYSVVPIALYRYDRNSHKSEYNMTLKFFPTYTKWNTNKCSKIKKIIYILYSYLVIMYNREACYVLMECAV